MTSKRFIALLVLCMSLGVAMNAAPVTLEQAQQAATSFVLKKQMPSRSLRVATTAPKKLKSSDAGDASAAFYVFNIGENQGFVIVSGDDRTNPILGYSDQGSFDETKMPANMKAWLDEYALQLTQLDEVKPDSLSDQQKIAYYNQQSELNLYRSEMAQFTKFFYDYIKRAQYYRQLVIQIAPKDSYDYVFNQATYICEADETDQAIQLLEHYLLKLEEGSRTYSIVTSTLAYFYQKKQMPEQQERYLLLSAISDERGAIRENNSLRSLSEILMARGDNDNAYRYLFQAISEARFYGSRIRMMQVGRMAPQILQLYDAGRTQTQQRTNIFLTVISIISLVLAGIIVYTLILYRKKHAAGLQIIEMNKVMARHNEEIENANTQMKEANRIKEEYIGRFLELSSMLLSSGEQRLKQLNRLARERKLEELYAELKTMEPLNTGIRTFHSHFDTAFLNIYPNFISEVNKLLTPENQFTIEEDGSPTKRLTTELRVLALIRLDITDNQKIADILRSSITTIYTYRSKLKAKAINKDAFEDNVRKIATY